MTATMLWNGRTLNANSPIISGPPHAQRHFDPDKGDRLTAWETVPVNHSLDGNCTPACGELWFLHYGVPGRDGWHFVLDAHTGKVRAMTKAELRRPASKWGHDGIKRWRDGHGNHVLTLEEGLAWAVAHHRLIAIEVKGPNWARVAWCFIHLRAACVKTGHPAWVKRLVQLRFPRATVVQAHAHGVKIAGIAGSHTRGRARRKALVFRYQRGWGKVHFDAVW